MSTKNRKIAPVVFAAAALAVAALALFAVPAIFRRDPPPTAASLMAALEIPEVVSAETLREAVRESFLRRFGDVYGIDPEPAEVTYFTDLLKENPVEMSQAEHLRKALQRECARRRIPEATMIRQIIGIRDPAERERIRTEWNAAGLAAVLESADFLRAMEPVYDGFYGWWTQRHPEYEGLAVGIKVTDDHEALVEQVAVSLRREAVVHMARQLETRFVADLRKRGKVISEAKQKKAFALFVRFAGELCPEDMMRRMADAIVTETELTDDEILHCMLLKNRSMTDERLTAIQGIQARYLESGMSKDIPAEIVSGIQKELEEISGVKYNMGQ